MPKLKKIAGVLTVIMLTFVIPALVTTVTSQSTDTRSKAADSSVNTSTNDTSTSNTSSQQSNDTFSQMASKIYPIVVGVIVFIWLVVILIYVGFSHRKKF